MSIRVMIVVVRICRYVAHACWSLLVVMSQGQVVKLLLKMLMLLL